MDPFLLIYISGVIIIPIASLILNCNYKWITKNSSGLDGVIEFIYEIIIGTLLWPIILIFALIIGAIYLIYHCCIPSK